MSLADFLMSRAAFLTEGLRDEIFGQDGINHLEKFARGAEPKAHELGRQAMLDIKGDGQHLTDHAARMRAIAARIVLLRDGYVPALKIDQKNNAMRDSALQIMAYLMAQFEALDNGIRD